VFSHLRRRCKQDTDIVAHWLRQTSTSKGYKIRREASRVQPNARTFTVVTSDGIQRSRLSEVLLQDRGTAIYITEFQQMARFIAHRVNAPPPASFVHTLSSAIRLRTVYSHDLLSEKSKSVDPLVYEEHIFFIRLLEIVRDILNPLMQHKPILVHAAAAAAHPKPSPNKTAKRTYNHYEVMAEGQH
jgi:hypothetical protein